MNVNAENTHKEIRYRKLSFVRGRVVDDDDTTF